MKTVRYGMAGFGGIAERRLALEGFGLDHARFGSRQDACAVLVAATDPAPGRKEAALALGLDWCGSVEDMLRRKDIDAVCIAAINSMHHPLGKAALLAGKHVFMEKPLATRYEDAVELGNLAAARGLSLGVDHMMTGNAFNREARRLAESGNLGKLDDIHLHMEFLYGSTPEEAASWRCAGAAELGGPVGDVGTHCLYMAEYLTGRRIVSIGCVYLPRTLDLAVENAAFIQFLLEGGLSGTATLAFNRPRGGMAETVRNLGFELYGTNGVLRSRGTLFQLSGHPDEPVRTGLSLERNGEVEEIDPPEKPNIYRTRIEAHARSVLEGSPLDGSEGIRNLALLELCHESARLGGKMLHADARG